MNRIRTKIRNRLRVNMLDIVLRLRLSTKPFAEFDYTDALERYLKSNVYSLGQKRMRHAAASSSQDNGRTIREQILYLLIILYVPQLLDDENGSDEEADDEMNGLNDILD